jgi:PAS domain S-box-containing protein
VTEKTSRVYDGRRDMDKAIGNTFKKIFDNMYDFILITLLDGTIVFANRAAIEFYGYIYEEMLSMNISQIDVKVDRDNMQMKIERAFEHGIEFQTLDRKKDGTVVPVRVRTVGMQEKIGKQKYFISTVQDMTNIYKTQNKADMFDVSRSISSEAFIISDLDFIIKEWNHSAEVTFGYQRAEVLGKNIDFLLPMDRIKEFEYIKKELESGKTIQNFKTKRCRKEGSSFMVKCSYAPLYDENSNMTSYMVMYSDLTELEMREELLKEHQKRSALALEGGDFGIWDFDYSTKELVLHNGSNNLFGYSNEELVEGYENLLQQVNPEDMERVRSFQNEVNKEKALAIEFCILPKGQTDYRWVRMKGKVFDSFENGKSKRLVGTYEDITDKKMSEIELESNNKKLEMLAEEAQRANRVKSLFIANISHEIRTPLNGIIMAAQLLREEEVSDISKDLLALIHNASEILKNIVTDILDLSKAEQEGVHLLKEKFTLVEVIRELFRDLQIAANQKDLDASCYIDPQMEGEYIGDVLKIKQILNNLLSNALKFTEEGMIGIRAKVIEMQNNYVKIEFRIKDTGVGIGTEFQGHMFEAFTQEEESDDKKYCGTGLGLTICKKYSDAMEGNLLYEGDRGKGSTFIFQCILRKISEHEVAVVPPSQLVFAGMENGRRKILSVDDNIMNQELIKHVIEKEKINFTAAYSAKEALEILNNEEFDVILMDIQMPYMNGYRLTEKIRGEKKRHNIPIIAMTAYARLEDKEKCMKAGMDDYITKPIDIELLIHKIRDLLERAAAK